MLTLKRGQSIGFSISTQKHNIYTQKLEDCGNIEGNIHVKGKGQGVTSSSL